MEATPLVSELVERDRELELLRAAVGAAAAGDGALVVVEAPAGQGKTSLLRALRGEAQAAGLRVVAAAGAQLERDFPFGVVRQLFEGELHARDDAARARLLSGAASAARAVFEAAEAPVSGAADASFARLHGLYWLAANLAEERPLALVVDDAHWADAPSLRFLDALARRLEGLPLLLALGARPSEPGAHEDLIDRLVADPRTSVIRPRALSRAGIAELLRRALESDADERFVAVAAETTAGNPLLVRELLRTLAEEGFAGRADEVDALRRALPGNVGRIVVGRLRRLAPDALALARAVAVLGDGARAADAAALAGLDPGAVADAHAALARAGLFAVEALRFAHPIVREAVAAELVGPVRAEWHRRAAELRAAASADPAEVAAHLLTADPAGAEWAAEALAAAGRRALLDGAPDVAVRHLRRALAEPPPAQERQALLLSLGQAEARAGEADALEHLEQAAAGGGPLGLAADRMRAHVLIAHGRAGESVALLRRALEDAADDPDLARELEDDLVDALAHDEPARAEYRERLAAASADRPTLLSHLAFARAIAGAPAGEVLALARRALAAPAAEGDGRFVHYYAVEALMLVEAADEAADALRQATALARRLGSPVVAGPLTYMASGRAAWERAFGDLRHAEDHARYGLELVTSAGAPAIVVTLRSSLAAILIDRGRLDEAEAELAELPALEEGPGLREIHAMRGRLRLLQGRPDEALVELERELELERRRGWEISNREPTRATLVRTLAALGRRDEARAAAREQVELAVRRGVAGAEARARLALASALDGDEALDELRAATATARRSPSRLAQAEVTGALGAALRRAGERSAARELLAEARDLAHRCGASALEQRAHEELVIAGARPRRIALSGVESLTAAERRVAELAAQGLRNREIAEALFVTVKTVEVHLSRVYAKLGIERRSQLATALGAEAAAGGGKDRGGV